MIAFSFLWTWWAICEFADLPFHWYGNIPLAGKKRKSFRRWRGGILLVLAFWAGILFYLQSILRAEVNYVKAYMVFAVPLACLFGLSMIYHVAPWQIKKQKKNNQSEVLHKESDGLEE